jgi:Ulp1 family protease
MREFIRYYGRLYYSRRSGESTEPTYTINTGQSPQQNADDYGVFVIMNAWHMISSRRVGQLPWFDVMQRRLQIMSEIY